MLSRPWTWLSAWKNTLEIKYRNPGLYEFLKNYELNDEDFVEVTCPGGPKRLLVHKDALETMRKLGEENRPEAE